MKSEYSKRITVFEARERSGLLCFLKIQQVVSLESKRTRGMSIDPFMQVKKSQP